MEDNKLRFDTDMLQKRDCIDTVTFVKIPNFTSDTEKDRITQNWKKRQWKSNRHNRMPRSCPTELRPIVGSKFGHFQNVPEYCH